MIESRAGFLTRMLSRLYFYSVNFCFPFVSNSLAYSIIPTNNGKIYINNFKENQNSALKEVDKRRHAKNFLRRFKTPLLENRKVKAR